MYLKLTLRNAKRSILDYLLYITTMIFLIIIMTVSNYVAIIGNVQAGFQTVTLPLLITLILVILVGYINNFMLKQRSKEFANYLLLGMEKGKLTWMLLGEFFVIGIMCFVISSLIGFGVCLVLSLVKNRLHNCFEIQISFFGRGLRDTFVYFCVVEMLSAIRIKCNIIKLQIREIMIKKKHNQNLGDKQQYRFWLASFGASLFCLIGLIFGIVFLPEDMGFIIISFIALPLLLTIFAFYKWMFLYFSMKRQKQSLSLYQKDCLYLMAQITSETKTSTIMNSIFCVCLFFSAMSFMFGVLMLQSEFIFFDTDSQRWMGFLQISLCIIFIVIYFSVLSLQQIIELRREARDLLILHYMGKDKLQLKSLIKIKILIKLSIPAIMCISLMFVSIPLLNYKLNVMLPTVMENILIKSAFGFSICFLALYFIYFKVLCIMSKKYMEVLMDGRTR